MRPSATASRGRRLDRGWLVIAGGAVVAGVILVAWFPAGALLAQRAALDATTTRLSQLATESNALHAATQRLSQPAAQLQLARKEYQLVEPGQRLLIVLPPASRRSARSVDAPYRGDPGFSPLVDPVTGSLVRTGVQATRSGSGQGFLSRLLGTLEFWR